jgi:hypothetical protein
MRTSSRLNGLICAASLRRSNCFNAIIFNIIAYKGATLFVSAIVAVTQKGGRMFKKKAEI